MRYDLSTVSLGWSSLQKTRVVTLLSHTLTLTVASVCFPPPAVPPTPCYLPLVSVSLLLNHRQSLSVMSSIASQDTASTISQRSHGSIHEEDWDRSESDIQPECDLRTPRNSVLFPADGMPDLSPRKGCRRGNRTLSELLKLYAEKGTDCKFSQEEATRIADVLGQWVRLFCSYYLSSPTDTMSAVVR